MISAINSIQFNNNKYNNRVSFTGRGFNKVYPNFCDSFEFSDCLKFTKKVFNYAPKNSEAVDVYRGPMSADAGFSTEALKDVGGGYLKADCLTPLSSTGFRTCAALNAIDEETCTQVLYHVHDETPVHKIEQFLRKFIPDFSKVNIVGGDQYKTANTMKKIVQAVENVNPYAKKKFYHTVSENPEIVAYGGDIYYMKGKSGTVSFVQKDDYWY